MRPSSLEDVARAVFDGFLPRSAMGTWESLGGGGGFSGARLWRWRRGDRALCLRAWPAGTTPARLEQVQRWLAAASGSTRAFVPKVLPTADGRTWGEHAGRLWELQEWMPGRADFHSRPTPARLEEACRALAQLHAVWARWREPTLLVCPAVVRRRRLLDDWEALRRSGWRPRPHPDDPSLTALLDRAWRLLPRRLDRAAADLRAWAGRTGPTQPCLCDPWHDHFLFQGERLTGLVDYGAMKLDAPAIDLARALGSLVEDDAEGWRIGLEAYRGARPLSAEEEGLARMLDRTGTALGAANWLLRLGGPVREEIDRAGAGRRLAALLARLERRENDDLREP
jgi:homoserine kinase type II